jgi:co-chaperonin GroES (HSP10)
MATTQRLMQHDVDPAQLIWDQVGNLDDITLFGNNILLGVYERPEKTKSGIILTQQTRGEDEHQGKSGLVLKKGPTAFVSDANYDFKGQTVEVGDWVSIWVSDGRKLIIHGKLCRLVEDQHIRLKIPAPDIVF